jgi:WhiB family redox-sensing transcriptional regulator
MPWRDEALCAQVDLDLFFPEKGEGNRDAKRVCRTCPVQTACLEEALLADVEGIWGGLSQKERRHLQRAARRTAQRAAS